MTRRTISLLPALESIVRDFQADLLKLTDQDVTFTDALNLLLVGGIMERSPEKLKKKGKEWLINFLDYPGRHLEGVLDQLDTLNRSAPSDEHKAVEVAAK